MGKDKMVPLLRFAGFEGEWESKQGDEIFLSRRTKGREGLPMYSVTLTRGMIPRDALERNIGEDAEDNLNLFVAKGDIVYNMMRMWQGAFGLATVDCMVSGAYVVLEPKAGVDSKFFVYNFGRQIALYFFTSYSYGLTSDRLRLYSKDFAQILFAVPTFLEQTKIASFLSAVDEKLRTLKQKKAALEVYKKGVMQQLFSRELRFQDVDGEDFPDWEERTLGEVLLRRSEKYDPSKNNEYVRCIELEHIESESTRLLGFVDGSSLGSLKNRFQVGDVLFGKLRPYLKKILQAPFDGVCTSEIWVLKGVEVSNHFLFWLVQTAEFLELANQSSGSKMPRAEWNIIEKGIFLIPSLPEQTKIADFLSGIDEKIQGIAEQITQLEAWKKGLLQKMFV